MGRRDPTPVIGDLVTDGLRARIWCGAPNCRLVVTLDPADAVKLLGHDTTFTEAGQRLRCANCGARGRDNWIKVAFAIEDYYANLRARGLMG